MQAAHGHLLTWKQIVESTLCESDPTLFQFRLEVALSAIEARLSELRSRPDHDHEEILNLRDAQKTLRYLQKHEDQ
jgi:hypothetical protein